MKNNLVSISVYLDRRDHVEDPMTEEQAAMMRGYTAFRIRHKRAMNERDGISNAPPLHKGPLRPWPPPKKPIEGQPKESLNFSPEQSKTSEPPNLSLEEHIRLAGAQTLEQLGDQEFPSALSHKKSGENQQSQYGEELIYGYCEPAIAEKNWVFNNKWRAQWLATVHGALWKAKTWGEFKNLVGKEIYDEIIEYQIESAKLTSFEEYFKEDRECDPDITEDESRESYKEFDNRIPSEEEEFDPEEICGLADGDWPGAQEIDMVNWVPEEIQEKFGTIGDTVFNGEYLSFNISKEKEIVEAFRAFGYRCERDDELIEKAQGR